MGKNSSSKKLKESDTHKTATKKLDFLLDTIDTEVANLADVVEVQGPILNDEIPGGEGSAISLNDGTIATDSLELDIDLSEESDGSPTEMESADNQAQAALDAMSDAEGEVEAMLAEEAVPTDTRASAEEVTSKGEIDQDLAKALEELLATREVDASKLLEERAQQRQENEKAEVQGKEGERVKATEDRLPEDLFDDLDSELEPKGGDLATENQAVLEKELSEDLLEEVEVDLEVEKGDGAAEETAATTTSDEELADLLSKKIERLVTKLVEERLSEIAERVIMEKINKIFSSMK